jgi:hypothetical protein
VIVTCASGARSSRAVGLLRKQGYEKAVALAGGNPGLERRQPAAGEDGIVRTDICRGDSSASAY